jgi:short-subunit dehydrogenase
LIPTKINKLRNTALLTGGSSGIGFEIAKCLAEKGFDLVLTARDELKLEAAAKRLSSQYKVSVDFVSADLHNPLAPKFLFDFCQKKGHQITLLVNNAGYAIATPFDQTSMEQEEKFIRVLGISVIALTKLFLKQMLENGEGKIMMISSVAAFAPPSSIQTLYGPIKTFINRFSEALNSNYNHRGITSTAVCPGYTVTNFHTASGVQAEMDRVPSFMKKDANRVAKEAVIATLRGDKVCVPTKTFKIIVFLLRVMPHSLFSLFSKRLAPGRYDKK